MKKILAEVQSGKFAREWIRENKKGRPNFNTFRKDSESHPVEKVGENLRALGADGPATDHRQGRPHQEGGGEHQQRAEDKFHEVPGRARVTRRVEQVRVKGG